MILFSSSNHAKPFTLALGIAFTILTLTILGFALMNGGLDFRSRAAVESCRSAAYKNGKYSCLAGESLRGRLCCKVSTQPTVAPTRVPIPTYKPIYTPTRGPTVAPTKAPTVAPTKAPTPKYQPL